MSQTATVDRVKARVGTRGPEAENVVEAGHVRRFCEAIGDEDPRWREEAPPTFVVALAPDVLEIPEALEYGKGWLNGGDRFQYLEPVRIGDRIRSSTVLSEVYEKQGSSGGLLFLVFDTEHVNQHGRTAVRVRGTRIRR
jgi:hypothetical protein